MVTDDVAAYLREPLRSDEEAVSDLSVDFDLDDDEVDYDAMYGGIA